MRRVALALAALGMVVFLASMAVASPPAHAGAGHGKVHMVKHHGRSGLYVGHYRGYRGYRYGHGGGRVIVRPMVPAHQTIVYPFFGHPPVVHPPIHSYRYRHYPPHSGIYHRGWGIGFSIGF